VPFDKRHFRNDEKHDTLYAQDATRFKARDRTGAPAPAARRGAAESGGTAGPVCLRASSGCTVMQLDFSALLSQKTLTCPCRMQVTANLMQDMAQQLLFFNTKVRILAQKRLRDRLKIYLQTLTPDEKGCYSLPYTRTELADFLCVDRSALSRELCRMRDERILDFSGAKIHLLNPTFLYGWN